MRIEPEEEAMLVAERAILRMLCNWVWPIMFLGSSIWDIISFEERFDTWWRWAVSVTFYALMFHWWKKDVAKLRAVRQKIAEAHS